MGFFTPWFLAAGLAVGLPVWLHLLRKHKTTPLPFSSLMFFEKRTQSSIKHRRLRYLLLFAARALLVLLLVLAFAQPYVRQTVLASKRSGEVTVLAIDNSLSMRAGNRLSQAKAAAKSVIGGLRVGQRAQVLAFGSRVQVMSEVTDDHSSLNAAVDSIEPGDTRTSYAELSRSLRSIAQSLKLPLAVELYSDMQQTGWPANFNDLRLNATVQLNPHAIEAKETPNFTVENVVAPRRVYDAKKARVLATVAGFANKKSTRSVSLVLNGRVLETKQVEVPENGRATVEFLSLDVPYGRNKGEVRIDTADSLPADDTFNFSVERSDPRHALFVQESAGSRGLVFFKAALEAAGQSAFEIDPATVDQVTNVSPSKYAFVVLSDLGAVPPAFENALREYVRTGGSVWIALGHLSVGPQPRAGHRRRHSGGALRRPRGRALPDRRLARFLASFHPEGRPLGRRQILPGHSRGARQRARRRPPQRPDPAAPRPADWAKATSWSSPPPSTTWPTIFPSTPPSCPSSSRRPAIWDASMPARHRCWWAASPNCAIPRKRAPRWMSWTPRANAHSPWKRPPRPRTSSSPWPVSTISAAPTGATNWWP